MVFPFRGRDVRGTQAAAGFIESGDDPECRCSSRLITAREAWQPLHVSRPFFPGAAERYIVAPTGRRVEASLFVDW